nr:TlpA disulfide reductase family protein [Pedobacter sp. ASV19]
MKNVISDYGKTYYEHYKQEGRSLPDFHFVDLKGRVYDREKMKGKIVVLKCWFIKCTACIQEMPQLNKLVDTYKKRTDIVFVSLVPDGRTALNDFLKRTKFDYAVVPDKGVYITKDLKVSVYPTHFIINKKGVITKVINNADELNIALDKEVRR